MFRAGVPARGAHRSATREYSSLVTIFHHAGAQMQSARVAAAAAIVFYTSCVAGRRLRSSNPLQAEAEAGASSPATEDLSEDLDHEGDDGVDTKTVALAVVAAALITALVIYGFYKMCKSGTAAERASQLFKFDKSGRGNPDRGAYMRHSDSAVVQAPVANTGPGGLPTIPSDATL